MVEGEFGDHLVLRAIVNVVGYEVRVLTVNRVEIGWTRLQPLKENLKSSNPVLTLGLVGEFHYVSLRPLGK